MPRRGVNLDVTERKLAEGKLEHLADHDTLTGVFNRRRFDEELDRELVRAHRYGGKGAVMMLDLDGFKFVNDSLGHAAGDELVASLAATMTRTLRSGDVVARMGGDEFAIALPEADLEAALVVTAKLLTAIRQEGTIVRGDRHAAVTASIGVTVFDAQDQLTTEDLIVEADSAMYDAKRARKDRACIYRRDEKRREQIAVRQNRVHQPQDAV